MRIAVTGNKGRLGSELVRQGCIPFVADITNLSQIKAELADINPDIIINCAAYTDVSHCETTDGAATALNVNYFGVKNLRLAFPKLLIHISTDYVFEGKKGPYSENAKLSTPINYYGMTKLGAESMLQSFPFPFCIVRTTCLYEVHQRTDFVAKVLDNLSSGKPFEATRKLSGNPTYIPHLVEAILKLMELPSIPEIIHLSGKESLSRYEFALTIASVFHYDKFLITPTTKEFWQGNRPEKAGFKTALAKRLGLPIYTTVEGLEQYKKDWVGLYA